VVAQADAFATGAGWTENLGFDGHGGMWVSELFLGRVVRYDAGAQPGRSIAISTPGAVELGPDGLMYANYGDSSAGAVESGQAGVVRFDPTATSPIPSTFVSGLQMANGAAFDRAGNLYVSNSIGNDIVKVLPDGTIDPSFAQATAGLSGANGLVVTGGYLYVTLTSDQYSSVVRVPLNDPATHTTIVRLSMTPTTSAVPKGLDDLALGADGNLYIASAMGQLLRVDPRRRTACLLYSGPPLTSARFATGFPPFDARSDLFLTSETGEIIHVHLSGS
jgi:sugar lactone lactonase YvrE